MSNGDLLICDYGNHRIRKVTVGGVISTYAGTGTNGYSGDSGAPTSAAIFNPSQIVITPSNDVYFSDSGNLVVRKISNNVITTVTKTSSDAIAYSGGLLYYTPSISTTMVVSHPADRYYCNSLANDASGVCSGHGLCYNNTCQCEMGYYGSDCQYFDCAGYEHNNALTCSRNGVCVAPNTCQCNDGYYGDGLSITLKKVNREACWIIPNQELSTTQRNNVLI